MSIIQSLIMVVMYLQLDEVVAQAGVGFCNISNYPDQSPIQIDRPNLGCSYNEQMDITFPNTVTTVQASYTNGVFNFTNFPQNSFTLHASDVSRTKVSYQIAYAQIVTPMQHNFTDLLTNGTISSTTLELQIFFNQLYVNKSTTMPQAALSILFTDSTNETYLPDGTGILTPLFQYGTFSNPNMAGSIDANFFMMFQNINDYYHQWFAYLGRTVPTSTGGCNQLVNWYVNSQMFLVNKQLLNRYNQVINSLVVTKNFSQITNPPAPSPGNQAFSYANVTPLAQFPTQRNTSQTSGIYMICYSGFEQTVLRQDYAFWLWVLGIFVWWIVEVITENDTKECFMESFENNRWTQLPLYSIYYVNNDIFFTKLSRFLLILVMFSWNVTILSILYAQFYLNGKYGLVDGIIVWYALIALLLGWPVSYFFGTILYNIRETWKGKTYLQTEWKKIIDKSSLEATELVKGIEVEEGRLYSAWFFFYMPLFFLLVMCFCVSIWQNTFLTRVQQNYWLASIFVMLVLDMGVFDVFVAFFPGPRLTKYRAFYYDFELGQAFKRLEETT